MTDYAYHHARFLVSAAQFSQLPVDEGYEVAFVGRSNSGKSSALNLITRQKNLARTSKTPGRTQLINLFCFDEKRRLVDLPGYGYAKVSASIKQRWQKTLADYLENRGCLKGLILLMDVRHPLQETDSQLLHWARKANRPVHVLLTKSDKLRRGPALDALRNVQKALSTYHAEISSQLFSSVDGTGLEEVYKQLDNWFEY